MLLYSPGNTQPLAAGCSGQDIGASSPDESFFKYIVVKLEVLTVGEKVWLSN